MSPVLAILLIVGAFIVGVVVGAVASDAEWNRIVRRAGEYNRRKGRW